MTVSFDLVVRDDFNQMTYGGGRVSLRKAEIATRELLDSKVYEAVNKVLVEGDAAFPKVRPPEGPEPESFKRRLHALAMRKNLADRPGRKDPFGSR